MAREQAHEEEEEEQQQQLGSQDLTRTLKGAGTAAATTLAADANAGSSRTSSSAMGTSFPPKYEGEYEKWLRETIGKVDMLWAHQDRDHVVNPIVAEQAPKPMDLLPNTQRPEPSSP